MLRRRLLTTHTHAHTHAHTRMRAHTVNSVDKNSNLTITMNKLLEDTFTYLCLTTWSYCRLFISWLLNIMFIHWSFWSLSHNHYSVIWLKQTWTYLVSMMLRGQTIPWISTTGRHTSRQTGYNTLVLYCRNLLALNGRPGDLYISLNVTKTERERERERERGVCVCVCVREFQVSVLMFRVRVGEDAHRSVWGPVHTRPGYFATKVWLNEFPHPHEWCNKITENNSIHTQP